MLQVESLIPSVVGFESCILPAARWGFADSWLEEVKLFFLEICITPYNGFAFHFTVNDSKKVSAVALSGQRGENQFLIPWERFCRMIKTRNDSRSALRGELVVVGMKWKSMQLSDLMKCEIKHIEVTRHFHLVVSD